MSSKIESFKDCAEHLCTECIDKKPDYNAAANRYYYYIFRRLRKLCEEKHGYYPPKNEAHEHLINFIRTSMHKKKLGYGAIDKAFYELRKIRTNADYYETETSEADIKKMKHYIDTVIANEKRI